MQSKATSPEEYLSSLPDDRREALEAIREVITANLTAGLEEGMQYGMIGYFVPLSVFPDGYHCAPKGTQAVPYIGLASQKNHMAIYLMCVYGNEHEEWFRKEWAKTGKKLDMGKSCLRFKKLENVALDVIGKLVKRVTGKKYLAGYKKFLSGMDDARAARKKKKAAKKKGAGTKGVKKAVKKKAKAVKKKAAAKKSKKKATRKS